MLTFAGVSFLWHIMWGGMFVWVVYKMGIIRYSSREPTTQPTTTHNPQLTSSRRAAAALPSSCSALYLHGNSRHIPGSWFRRSLWSHARRPWLGLAAPRWLVHLFWGQNEATSKNREEHGASALGGRHLAATHNNQPIDGGSSRWDVGEEARGG